MLKVFCIGLKKTEHISLHSYYAKREKRFIFMHIEGKAIVQYISSYIFYLYICVKPKVV